jgi:S1-C subfamily serine protease
VPSRPPLITLAAFAAAALVGGAAALAGAVALGVGDGGTTTVVKEIGNASPVAATSSALPVRDIYRRSAPGVVQITASSEPTVQTDSSGAPFEALGQQALGSGFVIDKAGHIVTNYHVVEGATEIEIGFSNHDTRKASIVGVDPSTDLAVLKVEASARALTPLPLADSDGVQVGDQVVAIGNPFGLERTATLGIVSALQRAVTAPNGYTIDHVIQTDAPINRGNSGGPLIDTRGRVIGVNSQIETGGEGAVGNVGIGFAVPSNTVKTVVAQLLDTGRVDRAYVGVLATTVTPELARVFRLPVDNGLLLERVEPTSPAANAGLRGGTTDVVVAGEGYRLGGDLLVAADGKRVSTIAQLRDALAAHRPGEEIEIEFYRGDKKQSVRVKLGRQPASGQR